MTEDEAKQKWCPFKHVDATHHSGEHCIGSDCMAWRWKNNNDAERGLDLDGHCGMAGKE